MKLFRRAVQLSLSRVHIARDVSFALSKPSWPDTVPKPPTAPNLGADYDTSWAREPLARVTRSILLETVTKPGIMAVTSPVITGLDRLKSLKGPIIFASNHSSHLDTSLILSCLPLRFRHKSVVAAGADYFFDKHWKAIFWSLCINIIPIEREKVARRSIELAGKLIADGWNLVIFPEGGRTPDGFMREFNGGAAFLSIRSNIPVVPIYIEGTRRIFGKGSHKVKPGRTRVTIGEPIRPFPNEKARDFKLRIQHGVAIAADEGRSDWWTARCNARTGTTPDLLGPESVSGWRRSWLGGQSRSSKKKRSWP